jgi:hypothetical protein
MLLDIICALQKKSLFSTSIISGNCNTHVMTELDKKIVRLNEEWKRESKKETNEVHSEDIDENSDISSSDSSYSDVEEDGLEKDEFVDQAGNSITASQMHQTLATVLKKHQEKLNQELEDMAQRGSFEEEGVFLSEEEDMEESDSWKRE